MKRKRPHFYWNRIDEQLLREFYPDWPASMLAVYFQCEPYCVHQKAARMGLHKSAAFNASEQSGRLNGLRGLSCRYAKGHVPANKGLRRPGWAPGRMRETQFKKGRAPSENANYQPIGTERICSKDGYLIRKVTDDRSLVPVRRWVAVHRLVWEAARGSIPQGHIVCFKPGMKTAVRDEITSDKLELLTMKENMLRNSIHNLPKPLKDVVRLRGRLVRQIHKRERKA